MYPIGTKITYVATNENSKRVDCVAEFVQDTDVGPEFKTISPDEVFNHPPVLQFVPALIEETPNGLRYKGELGGAVFIPAFLWVKPYERDPSALSFPLPRQFERVPRGTATVETGLGRTF